MQIGQIGRVGRMGGAPVTGVGPWAATRAKLMGRFAAFDGSENPHALPVMSNPPYIVYAPGGAGNGEAAPGAPYAGLTRRFAHIDGTLTTGVLCVGGGDYSVDGGRGRAFPVSTAGTSGGLGDGTFANTWRAYITTDAPSVGFRLAGTYGSATGYRFIVDGRYVSLTDLSTAASGGWYTYVLDFGARSTRVIAVESTIVWQLQSIFVAPGDYVAAPQPALSAIIFGDSFTDCIGATRKSDGLMRVAGDYLGVDQLWMSGRGGDGYTFPGVGFLAWRLSTDLGRFITYCGQPDLVGLAFGLNDINVPGIQSGCASALDYIRRTCPASMIVVVGPWDRFAPSAPQSGYDACKSAIQQACAGRPGVRFIDPTGVAYSKSGDTVHPDDTGHNTLGLWVNSAIRAAIAA